MSKENDEKIMQLREVVAKKKEELKKYKRFNPITTCRLSIEDKDYNLHTLTLASASYLLVKLSLMKDKKDQLKEKGIISVNITFSGYEIEYWIEDVIAVIQDLEFRNKKKELRAIESRLEDLLSEDKKTELETDKLEDMLKSL